MSGAYCHGVWKLDLNLHDVGLQRKNNNSCLTQYQYPDFCIDMNIAALFYRYIGIVDNYDSSTIFY